MSKWHFYPVGTGRILCHSIGEPLWTAEPKRVTCRHCRRILAATKRRKGRDA